MRNLPPSEPSPKVSGTSGVTKGTDLNALLFDEQIAIMRAEAATEAHERDGHREAARRARALIDLTEFPGRDSHDSNATTPTQQRATDGAAEVDQAHRRLTEMDRSLAVAFAGGLISLKSYQHRTRVMRQARARLEPSLWVATTETTKVRQRKEAGDEPGTRPGKG